LKTTFINRLKSTFVRLSAVQRIERAKLILLAVLIVSGIVLGYFTGTFSDILQFEAEPVPTLNVAGKFAPAAYPYAILISSAAGEHRGAIYNADDLSNTWNAASLALGEALGTAGNAISVREEEFRAAVGGEGIVFAYRFPIQLEVLLNWLNVNGTVSFEEATNMICLSASGGFANSAENYTLYYQTDDGRFFKRDGVSSVNGYANALFALSLPSVYFAFEDPDCHLINDYAILPDNSPKLNTLNVKIPQIPKAMVREILSELGMNPYNSSDYKDGDATVYAESGTTLKIYDYGLIEYTTKSEGYISLSAAESINLAYSVLTKLAESNELQLSECNVTGSRYEMKFDYIHNGMAVRPGASATVVVDGGRIRSLSVTLREYETTPDAGILLPMRQALAAAGADAYSMEVIYEEQGNVAVPVWIAQKK
jgi:hypothetical protein